MTAVGLFETLSVLQLSQPSAMLLLTPPLLHPQPTELVRNEIKKGTDLPTLCFYSFLLNTVPLHNLSLHSTTVGTTCRPPLLPPPYSSYPQYSTQSASTSADATSTIVASSARGGPRSLTSTAGKVSTLIHPRTNMDPTQLPSYGTRLGPGTSTSL